MSRNHLGICKDFLFDLPKIFSISLIKIDHITKDTDSLKSNKFHYKFLEIQ